MPVKFVVTRVLPGILAQCLSRARSKLHDCITWNVTLDTLQAAPLLLQKSGCGSLGTLAKNAKECVGCTLPIAWHLFRQPSHKESNGGQAHTRHMQKQSKEWDIRAPKICSLST